MKANKVNVAKALGILSIHLIALALASPAHSETDRSSLGPILKAYNKNSEAMLLAKSSSRVVFSKPAAAFVTDQDLQAVRAGVQDGDSVIVRFQLSESEARLARISELQAEIEDLGVRANHERRLSAVAENPSEEAIQKHLASQKKSKSLRVRPSEVDLVDLEAAVIHGDNAEHLELKARLLQIELDEVKAGRVNPVVQRIGQIDTQGGRISDIEAFMQERRLAQNKVLSVHRIPKASVLRGQTMVRAGWMGLAAAAVVGTVTVLEMTQDSQTSNMANTKVFRPTMANLPESSGSETIP